MFEPYSKMGLHMEDVALESNPGELLTFMAANEKNTPLCLKKGQVLGWLEPVSLVELSGMKSPDLETQHLDESDVAAVASINSLHEVAESAGEQQLDEREKKLLHLCGDVDLNPEEKQ